MGTGAVSGHSTDFSTRTQNGVHPTRKPSTDKQTRNHTHGGGDSVAASPTTANPSEQPPQPTDRSKVKVDSQMKMSCEMCSVNFTIFKRKKCCQECHRYFCSNCLPKPPSNSAVGRQCSKCRLLMSGHFSRDDLQNWKVKDMRCFLNVRNISTKDCREKHDLIELLLARFCTRPQLSAQEQIEHDNLVKQMAAHMRDVSFARETSQGNSSGGSSSNNSPAVSRNTGSTAKPSPPVPPPPMSSSSSSSAASLSSSTTTAQAGSIFTTQPQTVSSSSSSTSTATAPPPPPGQEKVAAASASAESCTAVPQPGADNQQERQAEGEFSHLELNSDRLRELLESMERIQEVLAQREEREQEEDSGEAPVRRTQLNDVTELSQIEELSVRQLKELLVNNFVDYRGCCEKAELVEKTKRLWTDHQENKRRAERLHKEDETVYLGKQSGQEGSVETSVDDSNVQGETSAVSATTKAASDSPEEGEPIDSIPAETAATTTTSTATTASSARGSQAQHREDSLCHVCMDSLVDCILLECGHMVTCTQCGKRLADCPVCRQYISRVVRVFRS